MYDLISFKLKYAKMNTFIHKGQWAMEKLIF